MVSLERPGTAEIWTWLAAVEDPEIPVISIVDLGIVRDLRWDDATCVVTVTPTYSGCPATHVISQAIVDALHGHGVDDVRIETRIAPPWTTDWMSEAGKQALRDYGIAPPLQRAQTIAVADIGRGAPTAAPEIACPRCASTAVELVSQFGSTPCKALYRCKACREPFDHFKCH
ncbi:MAG: phenylacetate-CoA oxygenase subunit PaaJ [Burkholderiales bacterium]|nr:phenylacetate-CoA oxygenase subunit PaaJ [Burkholderiales bacterium]MDE1925727.1 phenylacetate-CoA oxygenase subunit PaaJ [Burkholderiales bacterium]MDE2157866.1 phenylacetate-CoA oxygenase subunit PaaJ [Burkholderiales bacterium]MDE2502563.1 phenylacetate-CoA oxygenase subunit PaaJ [Burkholderiales bacterium]